MPVPKGKSSKSRRDRRSANQQAEVKSIVSCKNCKEPILPHRVCFDCGYYKGEKILRTKTDRMHERGQVRKEKEAKIKSGEEAVLPPEQEVSKE
jgi:large subunit ribosomal protein L32